MTLATNQKLPPRIYSEAVVNILSGKSLLGFKEPVTSKNVEQFHVDSRRMRIVTKKLEAQGFEILDHGQFSVAIRGSPELYEQVFNAKLTTEERSVIKAFGCRTTGTFISTVDAERPGFIDTSQSPLADLLDGVAINEPAYYFGSTSPSACPPSPSYWHLKVPDGIARGLCADRVHVEGLNGCGVKVVMVDTGWYASHPFFKKQGYHAEVVAGPGVSDCEDTEGHGTGESANLLAVAPGIEFIMVKADVKIRDRTGNVNSIAAIRKAISLQPDIITCSWGTNCTEKPLSPYERILEATIADAIRQGIIVIVAAGNGHCGFPAQHPEVIAAGGVYMDSDGSLQASDYASGFESPIYRQRFVPDVCGLVGKPPRAAYIMLPVPPGSTTDQQLWRQGARYPDGDETEEDDGWAAFSGTSASAPQIAGVCALMKQANRELSPQQAKEILQLTARDVSRGCCSQYTGSNWAGEGFDLATGYGLVDAFQAVKKVQTGASDRVTIDLSETEQMEENMNSGQQKCKTTHQNGLYNRPMYEFNVRTKRWEFVGSDPWSEERRVGAISDPILQKLFEDILWEFDKILQNKMQDKQNQSMPRIELSNFSFAARSELSDVAATLRTELDNANNNPEMTVAAAEGLLKIGRYQKKAIERLSELFCTGEQELVKSMTENVSGGGDQDQLKLQRARELKARALKALAEINTEATANADEGS